MDPLILTLKLLRIVFYICVIAALVGYCAERFFDYPNTYWIWAGLGAIGTSVIRFFLKFI